MPGPGVVAGRAGWYTAVTEDRGASPAASDVTARGGKAREDMSWRPTTREVRRAPVSSRPGPVMAGWRPEERRTSETVSVTRHQIR